MSIGMEINIDDIENKKQVEITNDVLFKDRFFLNFGESVGNFRIADFQKSLRALQELG